MPTASPFQANFRSQYSRARYCMVPVLISSRNDVPGVNEMKLTPLLVQFG